MTRFHVIAELVHTPFNKEFILIKKIKNLYLLKEFPSKDFN